MWPHAAHPSAAEESPIIYFKSTCRKLMDSKPKNVSYFFVMLEILWLLRFCNCRHRLWLRHRCKKRSAGVCSDRTWAHSRLGKAKSKGLIRRCKARHFRAVLQLPSWPFSSPLSPCFIFFSHIPCCVLSLWRSGTPESAVLSRPINYF